MIEVGPVSGSNPHVDYERAYNQALALVERVLETNARVLKHNDTLAAEIADLREELAAMRHNRQLGVFDLTGVRMENGVDLFVQVHDEKHHDAAVRGAEQYGKIMRERNLDCKVIVIPPGVEVSARERCCSELLPESFTCSHCGQPDCLPHVEGCPEMMLDAMQDDCPLPQPADQGVSFATLHADTYCPACGGWGDHRIGCPNK